MTIVPSTASRHGYRPEIDGVRGVAVMAVILNHLSADLLPIAIQSQMPNSEPTKSAPPTDFESSRVPWREETPHQLSTKVNGEKGEIRIMDPFVESYSADTCNFNAGNGDILYRDGGPIHL